MNRFPSKRVALVTLMTLGFFITTPSYAALLRSTNGMPVLTKDGACVTTGFEGSEGCEAAKAEAGMEPAPTVEELERHEKVVYFDFNKTTLTPAAKQRLDHLAARILKMARHKKNIPTLTVVGYADRIGKADYNQKLALKRAETVRRYLESKGISAKKIEVRSLGKTVPRADCSADLPRAKLINCLREDRRVEIEFGHVTK